MVNQNLYTLDVAFQCIIRKVLVIQDNFLIVLRRCQRLRGLRHIVVTDNVTEIRCLMLNTRFLLYFPVMFVNSVKLLLIV